MTNEERHEQLLAVEYIAAMLSQLRLMAQSKDLNILAYLIDMAQIEAGEAANQMKGTAASIIRN